MRTSSQTSGDTLSSSDIESMGSGRCSSFGRSGGEPSSGGTKHIFNMKRRGPATKLIDRATNVQASQSSREWVVNRWRFSLVIWEMYLMVGPRSAMAQSRAVGEERHSRADFHKASSELYEAEMTVKPSINKSLNFQAYLICPVSNTTVILHMFKEYFVPTAHRVLGTNLESPYTLQRTILR